MILNGKRVNLLQLQAELAAAGVAVTALGQSGDVLHTYDLQGAAAELPAGSPPVVQAHIAAFKRPKRAAEFRAEWQAATAAQKTVILAKLLGLVDNDLVDE